MGLDHAVGHSGWYDGLYLPACSPEMRIFDDLRPALSRTDSIFPVFPELVDSPDTECPGLVPVRGIRQYLSIPSGKGSKGKPDAIVFETCLGRNCQYHMGTEGSIHGWPENPLEKTDRQWFIHDSGELL